MYWNNTFELFHNHLENNELMHNVHDLNDYEDLLIEVPQHRMLLWYNHVHIDKDRIIHSKLLDQPINKIKKKSSFFLC